MEHGATPDADVTVPFITNKGFASITRTDPALQRREHQHENGVTVSLYRFIGSAAVWGSAAGGERPASRPAHRADRAPQVVIGTIIYRRQAYWPKNA